MENIVLEVKNLTKKFGSFTAVDNLSFSIKDGEILGLLGPNGAGKTTTIQMLLGIMEPTQGDVAYFGKPFKQNREQILKQINFSSTYISFPMFFTISEILEVFARLYEVPDRKKRIRKLLDEFEIGYLTNRHFHKLSAGERTRVLLVKSFLNYPRIILLDEPTSSLDPEIAVKVREFLKTQKEKYKVSMLFTSHNMSEVEEMCDRIIILNHGKIIAKDTPENLVKSIESIQLELFIKEDIEKAIEILARTNVSFKQDKSIFRITTKEKDISKFLIFLAKEKIQYEEISIRKPDLEDYFLQIIKK